MEKFENLGINKEILQSIKKKGFKEPTYIQEKTIPPILENKDVIGQSATGSGKTLAFGAGLIQRVEKGKGLQGIVLTPTRELAEQVSEALKEFSAYKKLFVLSIYGGVSINPQIDKLPKADIVVGTPGRVLDHLERETMDLSNVKIAVLDEADRMLDMGFIDDVKKIISQCPEGRQTLLFSATMSADILNIKHKFMKNPVEVLVRSQVDPTKLKQVYFDVREKSKLSLLITLLDEEKSESVIVFCNTRRMVDLLTKNLELNSFNVAPIHGGFTQAKRSAALKKFTEGKAEVLVCTDVAARGLDIPDVSHVYNYDIPQDSKDYVHRIGRTARAGKEGMAINLLSPRDHENFSNVLREFSQLKVKKEEMPKLVEVKEIQPKKREGNFRKGNSGRDSGREKSRGPRREGRGKATKGRGSKPSKGPKTEKKKSSKGSFNDNRKKLTGRGKPRKR